MHTSIRAVPLLIATALACAAPAADAPDTAGNTTASTLIADLLGDVEQVESKMVGLARAIPPNRYGWKPAANVRTVAQVLKHVAADNYLLPAALGNTPDPSTGIKGDDYQTAVAYEAVDMSPEQIIGELERSFTFLKTSLQNASTDRMGDTLALFGSQFTAQQVWIMTTTHVHEHLGQMIAYARSMGIAPPWAN